MIELLEKLVLDTSVLIEYVIASSPYRRLIDQWFSEALMGKKELYVSTVTLAETTYIASRIYRASGLDIGKANSEAVKFTAFISTRTKTIQLDEETSLKAGELKKKLHIALPDCITIATALKIKGKPVFKKIEKEMKPVIQELRKLDTIFLEEIIPKITSN